MARALKSAEVATLFPYPLPRPDPSWRTEAVVGISSGIRAEGLWDRLCVLADALEDAGCWDAAILAHLRTCPHAPGNFPNRSGGCWEGTCWVVQLLLGLPQRVLGRYAYPGTLAGDYQEAPVINPGDDVPGHLTWVVVPTLWIDGPAYVVETRYAADPEEILVNDDDFGEDYRIAPVDLKDYVTDPGDGERPPEYRCAFTDGGNHAYDHEDFYVYGRDGTGVESMLYFAPGLPHAGVPPRAYGKDRWDCVICQRECVVPEDEEQLCGSPECAAAYAKMLVDIEKEYA